MTTKTTLASLCLVMSLAAAPAVAGSCVTPADETVLNARVLQTELMVAALSCNEQQRYNAFVSTFRSQIATQSASLRKLFSRTYGGSGKRQLNAYVTKLANDASMRSANVGKSAFCSSASKLFAEAMSTPPQAFERLTRSAHLRAGHGFTRCR